MIANRFVVAVQFSCNLRNRVSLLKEQRGHRTTNVHELAGARIRMQTLFEVGNVEILGDAGVVELDVLHGSLGDVEGQKRGKGVQRG